MSLDGIYEGDSWLDKKGSISRNFRQEYSWSQQGRAGRRVYLKKRKFIEGCIVNIKGARGTSGDRLTNKLYSMELEIVLGMVSAGVEKMSEGRRDYSATAGGAHGRGK